MSHDGAIELAEDVDLLIHDAQFLDDEWQVAARLGHSTVGYAVQLAQDAGARRLLLYHHDPSRTDGALDELSREMGNHAPLRVEVAREGQVIDVGRTESG